jgi:hypothetical protein
VSVFVLILWSGIVTAMAVVDAPVPLRIAFAGPVVLFVPGWLTLRIVVIGWTRFEMFVGAVAVSLSEIIFLGFFLYSLGGLRPLGWIASITALMAALLLVKPLRTARLVDSLILLPRLPARVVAYLAGATMLFGLALAIAIRDAGMDRPYDILQLWIVPMPSNSVAIGIANGDGADRSFRLDVRGEARTIEVLENVEVKANSTFTVSIKIKTGSKVANEERVQAVLSDLTGRALRRASTTLLIPSK